MNKPLQIMMTYTLEYKPHKYNVSINSATSTPSWLLATPHPLFEVGWVEDNCVIVSPKNHDNLVPIMQ